LWRWAFPTAVFLLWLLGDIRMFRQRHRIRGLPPVRVAPAPPKGLAFLRHPVTTTDVTISTYTIPWPGPDLRLVHLSDLHLNHDFPQAYYQAVIDLSNQQEPDLVLISGDLVSYSIDIPLISPLIGQLNTTAAVTGAGVTPGKGVFASLGNHDYWSDPHQVGRAISQSGVSLLSGKTLQLTKDCQSFILYSDDRPWGPGICLPSGGLTGGPGLVLSHSPDNIFKLARLPGIWAVFSGHVHAGQFRLPLPWGSMAVMLPSAYGRLLDRGHFSIPAFSRFGTSSTSFCRSGIAHPSRRCASTARPKLVIHFPP
jgi:predicted MPP superfamily phosphohydrolase